jgi:hypothetical protein
MTFLTWKRLGLFNNVFRLWEQNKIRKPFAIVYRADYCELSSNDGRIRLGRGTKEEMTTAFAMLSLFVGANS